MGHTGGALMGNYDFKKDLKVAQSTEFEVGELIQDTYDNMQVLDFNNDGRYDIRVRIDDEIITIEVKEDFMCEKTGNVSLEFESRGKPSGISVSEADYYVYKIHRLGKLFYVFIRTRYLKEAISNHEYHRVVNGGDRGSNTMNYLFKYEKFIRKSSNIIIRDTLDKSE